MNWRGASRGPWPAFVASLIVCSGVATAYADDDDAKPPVDRSHYSLFNPTPEKDLREFAPDRPCKVDNPFTVDPGHILIEGDLANYQKVSSQGVTTRAFRTGDPIIRLGVLPTVDLGMELDGYELVRQIPDKSSRRSRSLSGYGDISFSARINLVGDDQGDFALATIPFVKLPASTSTSLVLGDGVVEGGVAAVAQFKLPYEFTLNIQSEVDALEGGNDSRRHPDFINIVSVSRDIPGIKDLEFTAEIFSSVSADRYTPTVYTADFGLGYLLTPTTQLDVETDIGLNRAAPSYVLYLGLSQRF